MFEDLRNLYIEETETLANLRDTMDTAKRNFALSEFLVEQAKIDEVGDIRKIGSNDAARTRVFEIAKAQSTSCQEAYNDWLSARKEYEIQKALVRMIDYELKSITKS